MVRLPGRSWAIDWYEHKQVEELEQTHVNVVDGLLETTRNDGGG